ncbi:MAG: cytochrome c biogenesis heme-transporting ATPase CcmA [Gammaproteobacteria bacterium]|nr:MAG: cytochrome c biogenesis heme-transporting ATPase CcmA [Gammaproteobacteria bacterium]
MEKQYAFTGNLEVKNLACFRNEQVLFSKINLSLSPENVLFLQGENGSGKTSLLRILCGFRLPDEGEIMWGGDSISAMPEYFQNISYVGHKNGIKDELTVEENLNLMRSMATASEIKTESVLKNIGLFKQADVVSRQLSAGQKRKLALARLMMTNNSFWILDEPFTSLDKASVAFFESLIKQHIKRGGMLILTSHHEIDLSGLSVSHFSLSN